MKMTLVGSAAVVTMAVLPSCSSSPSAGASPVDTDAFFVQDASVATEASGAMDESQDDRLPIDSGSLDDLNWVSSDGVFACAELAPVGVPTFGDVVAQPGRKLIVRVRVKAEPNAGVPLWLWQITRVAPAPPTMLDGTVLDESYTAVSIPLEQVGTYHIVVHSHYPGVEVCAGEVTFEAK